MDATNEKEKEMKQSRVPQKENRTAASGTKVGRAQPPLPSQPMIKIA
jgi:hypothetical protein